MELAKLLEAAKVRNKIKTESELAAELGVSRAALANWRSGQAIPKPEHAQLLAELAGVDPAEVVADVLIKSSKSPALTKTLRRFLAVAVVGMATVGQCILCKMLQPFEFTKTSQRTIKFARSV